MKVYTVALAGNPNTGKTTVFNALTGTHQRVGNWPGVTVEKKEGEFVYKGVKFKVVDLPGTYSLTAYSIDQQIARDFLAREKPDVVVQVVDATNLERNLYLLFELLELEQNVVVALNMMDMVKEKGEDINTALLSQVVGVPFIPLVATRAEGIEQLKEAVLSVASSPPKSRFRLNYGDELESVIKKISADFKQSSYPPRFFAIKFLEGDPQVLKEVGKSFDFKLKRDPVVIISEKRYAFIKGLVREAIVKKFSFRRKIDLTEAIDKVVLNRILGIPIFLGVLFLTFEAVFKLGNPLAGALSDFFSFLAAWLEKTLSSISAPPLLISFLTKGVLDGVGTVVSFVPNIFILFLIFSFLEDTGYMARAAFVVDRVMHLMGLHGKSFIPMVLGFGCNVPAVMATRTLETEKDRILTILVIPLMSCSARLPVYLMFAALFFKEKAGLIVFSLYVTGVALAVIVAFVFRRLFFKGKYAPLIMELPPYRLPTFKNIFVPAWQRTRAFLTKAGTVILLAVVLIWALASLPFGVGYASERSIVGFIGKIFSPIFYLNGFPYWQIAVALFFGVMAKEVIIGTLGALFGSGEALMTSLQQMFNPLSAYAFLLMVLLYFPCLPTFAVIKKEAGWKWAFISAVYTLILAWLISALFYQGALLVKSLLSVF